MVNLKMKGHGMLQFNEKRSGEDRRSGKDRRRRAVVKLIERRSRGDRRLPEEQRAGWVRVTPWKSVLLGLAHDCPDIIG